MTVNVTAGIKCPPKTLNIFNSTTGCPVVQKCAVGQNGFISLNSDPNLYPLSTINTTTDGSMNILAPFGQPCSLIIQNKRNTSLSLQISGPNVAASLIKLGIAEGT